MARRREGTPCFSAVPTVSCGGGQTNCAVFRYGRDGERHTAHLKLDANDKLRCLFFVRNNVQTDTLVSRRAVIGIQVSVTHVRRTTVRPLK